MRRRRVLAAASAALFGGCLGTPRRGDPTRTTPAGTTTDPSGNTGATTGFRVTEFEVSTEKVAPSKRYFLRITKVYSSRAVEREEAEAGPQTVRDVSAIDDPALRSTIETILSEGRVWRNEIPDGLQDLVDRVDFFTWEARTDPSDTASHWGIEVYRAYPDRDPVVEFGADLVDNRIAPGDPGAIDFSLTNVGDRPQTVFSGTVPPFSILWADRPDGDDRALLWRDYAEEGCVSFGETGDESTMTWCSIGVNVPIEPGETIERRYELRPAFDREAIEKWAFDDPGEYTVADTVSYHRRDQGQGPSAKVDWSATFDLEGV